jgi:two-component system, LuxR family, response regulator FixJ
MPSERPIVHVIDDDEALRDSITFLLRAAQIEAQAHPSASVFLEKIPEAVLSCIITDVRMPGLSGMELLRRLKELKIDAPVIVITGHADVPLAVEAMKFGAIDFLEKPFDDEILLASVRSALRHWDGEAKRHMKRAAIESRLAALSNRERDVLNGLVAGRANKQIAFDLGISVVTVKLHRGNAMRKMQAGSVGELVRAWETLPPAVRQELQPEPKHSIRLARNGRNVGLGLPGHISEGHSLAQSGFGGDCR